jgi:hypothetical protein
VNRFTMLVAILVSIAATVQAGGLKDELKKLRGTVNEASRTTREIGELKDTVVPPSSDPAPQARSVTTSSPNPAVQTTASQAGDVLVGKNCKYQSTSFSGQAICRVCSGRKVGRTHFHG